MASQISEVHLSSRNATVFCAILALFVGGAGFLFSIPRWLLPVEVVLAVISLFVFGSIKYRVDKNAVAYGAVLIILATFLHLWWPTAYLRGEVQTQGMEALLPFLQRNFLSLVGLERLIHADTLLFIFGLTCFVAVIAQTRLLESTGIFFLRKNKGNIASTIATLAAVVAFLSGILDGVSMIGLTIRVYLVVLLLARVRKSDLAFIVVISTVVTTVCGMWLAYGEPPNLIMKANLYPLLGDAFFLRYCMPLALGSYLVVYLNIRKHLRNYRVNISELDFFELHAADVRFVQAERYGKVFSPLELIQEYRIALGRRFVQVEQLLSQGEALGRALVLAEIPAKVRRVLLSHYLRDDLAEDADNYYSAPASERADHRNKIELVLKEAQRARKRTQLYALCSFVPFIALLVVHAANHCFPLFFSSFAGFLAALATIWNRPRMRRLAVWNGLEECKDYLFLIPLFLSISLMQKVGAFDSLAYLLAQGILLLGRAGVALAQFYGCTLLSAMLDNNVVADFAGRALHGLSQADVHLFALAQIAGYALGGCLTHIGSAQSVVAYSMIIREVDHRFTPWKWIKMTMGIGMQLALWMSVGLAMETWLQSVFSD